MPKSLPFAALTIAACLAGFPASAQDMSGLDRLAERNRALGMQYTAHWASKVPGGVPVLHLPQVFQIPPQYAASVTKEERQAMGRKLRAIVDFILGYPALREEEIEVSVEQSLYRLRMNDGDYLVMNLAFTIARGTESGAFALSVNPYGHPGLPGEWRAVGQTAGGCQREQLTQGFSRGGERFGIGRPGPGKGLGVRAISFLGSGPDYNRQGETRTTPDSIEGRIFALMHGLDCGRLLTLAAAA